MNSATQEAFMTLNRRDLIMAGAAGVTFALSPTARAAGAKPRSAAEFRQRAQDFLAMLAPEERASAEFPLDGDVQQRWNFMGVGGFIKPGFRFEQMNSEQKDAGWHLLSAVLSPRGLEKARDVMYLQQVLIDMGSSASQRSPERYSLAFFGTPDNKNRWALRLEGHHLTLTFTVENDELTGITPSSFSVNPNRVEAGARRGLTTLKREDNLARKLAADLSATQRKSAFFMEQPFSNIRATAGNEAPFSTREGIAIAELSAGQSDLLKEIVDAYTLEHLAAPHAASFASRVTLPDDAAFGFSGSLNVGEKAYYRIHSNTMLIEFAAVDSEAQHLHTVFHLTG
jgi:Protein of unknown function (DUF3500)